MRNPIRRLVTALLLLLLVGTPLLADGLERVAPEKVGLSSERLARIGEQMQAYVDSEQIPGALGLIARRGKIAYSETWGWADRERQVPMRTDTLFRIYSMSKPITSVGLMILYEQGRFLLSDRVDKYLPELADLEVKEEHVDQGTGEVVVRTYEPRRGASVRDLLRHTAGFTYGFFGDTEVDRMYRERGILTEDADIAETVHKLGEVPLRFAPGSRWHYSVAVDVQGRLIEVLSGQPLDRFLAEHIFEPLGMKDTGFWVPEEKWDRFAVLYAPEGTSEDADVFLQAKPGPQPLEPAPEEAANRGYRQGATHFSGGGGLVSTVHDYLRFCQMMLQGGELDGVRILSPKTVELMTVDHLGDLPGFQRPGYGFGLGFAVLTDLGELGALGSEGEYNWGGAAGTRFWIDPAEELIGIYMIQILPHRGLTYGQEFRNLMYQAVVER